MAKESAFKFYSEAKKREGYWVEHAKSRFAVTVDWLLDFRGLKKKDLADRLGVSRPYISKILRGDANLTIETIGRLAYALDAEATINLRPKESKIKPWLYSFDAQKNASPANVLKLNEVAIPGKEISTWANKTFETREAANG